MSTTSKIEWTDKTWNPVRGCSLVSAGCANCYAMKQAHRFSGTGQPYEGLTELGPHGPRWTGKVTLVPDALEEPLRWKTPCRVFVNSMSDLFHEDVPDEFIERTFAVMALARRHTFQVLTKRPERMRQFCSGLKWERLIECCNENVYGAAHGPGAYNLGSINALSQKERFIRGEKTAHAPLSKPPLPNVWFGVSIEDQKTADERIPLLLLTPAAVRFVSYEPALGPVDLRWKKGPAFQQWLPAPGPPSLRARPGSKYIDWVIVGGESKDGARPMHPDWARSIRDQCQGASVPFFLKQWGEWKPISQMEPGESDALHVSRRKAKPYEDQDAIDELYGRRCTVKTQTIRYDGAAFPEPTEGAYELRDGYPAMLCFKVGKKAAGALLDGKEWREFPR